ncbi:MAG: shikimate dehydrogenase [Pseudomonadota bacterium]
MSGTGDRPRAAVIGSPIGQSRSPLIHGYWLAKHGIDGAYEAREVRDEAVGDFFGEIRAGDWRGCNVTVPHKVTAMTHVDEVMPVARAIGAANTIWRDDGVLRATNTDASGFMHHLRASVPDFNPQGCRATVIGAGGAARAIIFGLLESSVSSMRIVNRSAQRAQQLANDFAQSVDVWPFDRLAAVLPETDILINTTSLGMTGAPALECPIERLPDHAVVADIVYAPLETALLRAGRAQGLRVVDGLGMLLHQAVDGFELWFGVRPEVTPELRRLVEADLERSSC